MNKLDEENMNRIWYFIVSVKEKTHHNYISKAYFQANNILMFEQRNSFFFYNSVTYLA